MTTRPTPTRQRNSVSEGMAIALLALGYDRIPPDKVLVDLRFESAWRGWRYKGRFPQVNTDISHGLDGINALTRADIRKQVYFYWERGNDLEIHSRLQDWDPNDPEDRELAMSLLDGGVPWEGWLELASAFIRKYSD